MTSHTHAILACFIKLSKEEMEHMSNEELWFVYNNIEIAGRQKRSEVMHAVAEILKERAQEVFSKLKEEKHGKTS